MIFLLKNLYSSEKKIYLCSINRTIMTNDEEILVKILKLSHDQVMAGKSYSQEEAEHYLDQRLQNWRSGQHLLIGSSTN